MRSTIRILLLLILAIPASCLSEATKLKPVKIGVPTLLSGDWAGLGDNVVKTVKTYNRHFSRHPMVFFFEDAKISGADGLKAYQKLINVDHVDMLIGATSSNATMASASLINNSKTVMISPVTGGANVDNAGEWIFRLGNSDALNGEIQAKLFMKKGLKRVAVLSEETEYTLDIVNSFTKTFKQAGGELSYSDTFPPSTTDFRSQLTALSRTKPSALFIPTQTGSALALILGQLSQLGGFQGEIHTVFTAADNPDAAALAKGKFSGLHYLAPAFDKSHPKYKEFVEHYKLDHQRDPLIAFHTAAIVDTLDLLQKFLDRSKEYDAQKFRDFLLNDVKHYRGLMGEFSFDSKGNANTGFSAALIQ